MKTHLDRKRSSLATVHAALIFAVVLLIAPSAGRSQNLPDGEGKELVAKACKVCHTLDRVMRPTGHDPDDWQMLVERMTIYGAPLEQPARDAICCCACG